MQFAKDSFYMALRERLAALNPGRTVTINGATRPAVIVIENELPNVAGLLADAFYIEWGTAAAVPKHSGDRTLIRLECVISYFTLGTCDSEVDRGRALAALDTELLNLCQPPRTSKRDFTRSPSIDLGTEVFWTLPAFGEWKFSTNERTAASRPEAGLEAQMRRAASLGIFFFPEVNLL